MFGNRKSARTMSKSFSSSQNNLLGRTGRFASKVFHIFDNKLTIMIVPHSQGKVVNLQTNVFAMVLGIVIAIGILFSFVFFNKNAIDANAEISRLFTENRQTLASLDELRDENNNLLQTAKRFQSSLSQSLSLLGIERNVSECCECSKSSQFLQLHRCATATLLHFSAQKNLLQAR